MPLPFLTEAELEARGFDDRQALSKWTEISALIRYEPDPKRAFLMLYQAIQTLQKSPPSKAVGNEESQKALIAIMYMQLAQIAALPAANAWQGLAKDIKDNLPAAMQLAQQIYSLEQSKNQAFWRLVMLVLVAAAITLIVGISGAPVSAQALTIAAGSEAGGAILGGLFIFFKYVKPGVQLEQQLGALNDRIISPRLEGNEENKERKENKLDFEFTPTQRQDKLALKNAIESLQHPAEGQAAGQEAKQGEEVCCTICSQHRAEGLPNADLGFIVIPRTPDDNQPTHYFGPFHEPCLQKQVAMLRQNPADPNGPYLPLGLIEPTSQRPIPANIVFAPNINQPILTFPTFITIEKAKATYNAIDWSRYAEPEHEASVVARPAEPAAPPLPTASAAAHQVMVTVRAEGQPEHKADVAVVTPVEPAAPAPAESDSKRHNLSPV